MKRYKSILLVLFSILSCQSEIEQDANTNMNAIPMSFYAGIEIPKDSILTKTILDGSPSDAYRNVLWDYQDEVYVTNGSQSSKFINTSKGISETALLEGELAEGTNYFAAYPYGIVTRSASSSFIIDLPSEQIYCPDGIESEAFPMVAQCKEGVFNFKNICGILVVQLIGEQTVTSIAFSGKDSEGNFIPVAGSGTVSLDYSDVPTLVMDNSSDKLITLSCTAGVKLNPTISTSFHIVLPAGTYNTFKLVITAEDGSQMTLNSDKILTVRRSIRTTASAITFSPFFPCYIDEYGVNHGLGVKIDETVWAPVNCGYHATDFKYGKLYQWGRKYGQGYSGEFFDEYGHNNEKVSDATVPTFEEGGIDAIIGQQKSKANVFYTMSYSSDDWSYPQNDKLWNSGSESNPLKTEYDPCPDGWRVPTDTELINLYEKHSSWTTDEKRQTGCWFSGTTPYSETVPQVFFPAAGHREHYSYSNATLRGLRGYYWSSSLDGTEARCFCIYGGHWFTDLNLFMASVSRALGYSVRCVQE